MSDRPLPKLAAAVQKTLGLPPDLNFYSAFPFAGMNQQDARTAIDDQEFFWIENFLLTGKASMRTLWDRGTSLYTAPTGKTIVYFNWFDIGADYYCAVFLSDGTAVQVSSTGTVTDISTVAGTFYNGGQLPTTCQSSDQFLLIGNNLTENNYWIWDGTILYSPGSIGPYVIGSITDGGSGYTSTPMVAFYGGSGSGVTGTPVIQNGSVVGFIITNPGSGYVPSDTAIQVAFAGGGSDAGAILEAVIGSGSLANIQLITGGSGFTSTPTVAITGGGGTGGTATAVVTSGIVTALNLTNAGSGYTSTPTVTISGGGGTGARGVVSLSGGAITAVNVLLGGSGYTGTPQLDVVGGGGTGAILTANMTGGSISSATIVNGGTGYTSTPIIEVQTGLNNAASLVLSTMPFGVGGTSIETFQSRIWISDPEQVGPLSNGGVMNVSAPSSLTDFATSDGGLLYVSTDRYLKVRYIALRQSNGYLYPIGTDSVSVISNVQTSGNPPTTTFNYYNSSAQIGCAWRDTVQDFGQSVLFANANGVQGLYGGSVRRVSSKMNNIFDSAVFPPTAGAVTPSAAVANIHTIPVYLVNMTVIDPTTQKQRTIMLGWDEKNWLVASQSSDLTFINTQEVSSQMTAWGTDGNALFPLFETPSATLQKRLTSKMYGGEREYLIKEPFSVYYRASDKSTGKAGVKLVATMEAEGAQAQIGAPNAQPPYLSAANPIQPNFSAPDPANPAWGGMAAAVPGTAIGITITTTSEDFLLSGLSVAYKETAAIFG